MSSKASGPAISDLLGAVDTIKPLLAAQAAAGEEQRRITDAAFVAMRDAGLFRMTVPQRWGGLEIDFETYIKVLATLGEADAGAAWVATLASVGSWVCMFLSEEGQAEIWEHSPDAITVGVIAPTGAAERRDGGYVVSGRWGYASGSSHADWVGFGFPILSDTGAITDQAIGIIPVEEATIEDTWYVAGMRSSASNTIVVDRVFIPDRRVWSVGARMSGEYSRDTSRGVLYRGAMVPVLALVLVAPLVGMAQAALELVIEKAPSRVPAYTVFASQSESTAVQIAVSRAAMLVDTARLHLYRAAAAIADFAERAEPMDYVTRARTRADCGYCSMRAREAIDTLLTIHGAGSFAEANPLQRIWRDLNVASRHAISLSLFNEEIYGKALLGVPVQENISPLI